jgi:hypothetical protein
MYHLYDFQTNVSIWTTLAAGRTTCTSRSNRSGARLESGRGEKHDFNMPVLSSDKKTGRLVVIRGLYDLLSWGLVYILLEILCPTSKFKKTMTKGI